MLDKESTVQFLTALGDPIRLDIIFLFSRHSRLNVGEIAQHFRVSRPAISHHLKVLKDARILRNEKIGQEVYYWLDCRVVAERLHDLCSAVDACLSPAEQA